MKHKKEAAKYFLELSAEGKLREAFKLYVGKELNTTILISRAT